jgi:hypothetical protein
MSQNAINMQADKNLEADINKATTPDEIRELLSRAVERSGLGISRNPYTGQFEKVEQEAASVVPAAATAPKELRKTEMVAGTKLEFVASSQAELTRQILDANRIAATFAEANRATRASRDVQQEVMDRAEAERKLRLGTITTAEYLERTNAVENYLASQGIDTKKIAGEQLQHSWLEATAEFKRTTGADWPGGTKNQELIGLEIAALDLVNAEDKVAALTQAYEKLKSKGMLFDGDHDAAELEKLALDSNASPQEILAHWKSRQDVSGGDASKANEEFLRTFASGRSSGLFGR